MPEKRKSAELVLNTKRECCSVSNRFYLKTIRHEQLARSAPSGSWRLSATLRLRVRTLVASPRFGPQQSTTSCRRPRQGFEAIEAEGGDPNAAAAAIDPEGHGPRLFFKKIPRSSPEHIPIHLDLNAADREGEVERLAELGASIVETKTETTGPYTETWTVMRDPEGNGFCVQSPPEQ
ncbi:VOC family protein [Saliphagus sp. GCM10025308]